MKKKSLVILIVVLVAIGSAVVLLLVLGWSSNNDGGNLSTIVYPSQMNASSSGGIYESPVYQTETKSKTFSTSSYQWYLDNCSCSGNVGIIESEEIAIEKARMLWLDKYSFLKEDSVMQYDTAVAFDSENKCWHIYIELPLDVYGDGPHAIIHEDGTVLAVWVAP